MMLAWVKWIGTGAGMAGAATVALNMPFSGWGFVAFLVSSLAWAWVGWQSADRPLWTLQAAFTAINILGVYRWLLA